MGLRGFVCSECKVCESSLVLEYGQSCGLGVPSLRHELFNNVLQMFIGLDTCTDPKAKLTMFWIIGVATFCFWDLKPVDETLNNIGNIKRLIPVSS